MADGKPRIAFIGFGEAGQAIAAGLHDADAAAMTAWDILFPPSRGQQTAARRRCQRGALCRLRG
jgi:3-hydroxyisobutyrate dehydrogenase-like beta-hydroxyacid dehydrogenase